MAKMLIVYYSWSNGNTRQIAERLQRATGADIARIETAAPYAGSYDQVVAQGRREVDAGFLPPIRPLDADPALYDIIAVGTPAWWYSMAPAVKSFLAGQALGGKQVVPFMTHGGWPGHVLQDMAAACQGAEILAGIEVQFDSGGGSQLQTPENEIDAWIAQVAQIARP